MGSKTVDGDLLKVMTWYDNEWGFTNQMIHVKFSRTINWFPFEVVNIVFLSSNV
jgi:hypothetical protein